MTTEVEKEREELTSNSRGNRSDISFEFVCCGMKNFKSEFQVEWVAQCLTL